MIDLSREELLTLVHGAAATIGESAPVREKLAAFLDGQPAARDFTLMPRNCTCPSGWGSCVGDNCPVHAKR